MGDCLSLAGNLLAKSHKERAAVISSTQVRIHVYMCAYKTTFSPCFMTVLPSKDYCQCTIRPFGNNFPSNWACSHRNLSRTSTRSRIPLWRTYKYVSTTRFLPCTQHAHTFMHRHALTHDLYRCPSRGTMLLGSSVLLQVCTLALSFLFF